MLYDDVVTFLMKLMYSTQNLQFFVDMFLTIFRGHIKHPITFGHTKIR